MRSLPFALTLLLRIASGLSEQYAPNEELLPISVTQSFACQFLPANCPEGKECPRDVCSCSIRLCVRRTWFGQSPYNCWDFLPNCTDEDFNFAGKLTVVGRWSFVPRANLTADCFQD